MGTEASPSFVAAPGVPAALVETHISLLFFVGDRAYKLKKPVVFPFVDLRTRKAREQLCHREVELNRRFAPDVYLGVADITGPDGAVCDHLVVMRRMPDDRRLAVLVTDRRTDRAELLRIVEAVAGQLARFHAGAERSEVIDRAGSPEAVAALWQENFDELRSFAGVVIDADALDRAEAAVEAFIAGRRALFTDRIAAGRICDGHGDLQADDIFCLPDGPRILDCIEFCDDFRFGDVVGDVAFLAMDLERLGAPDLAHTLVASYEAASGGPLPPALLDFAIAYRAQVRAKVACLRWAQEAPDSLEAQATRDTARVLLDLCTSHLRRTTVGLVLVGGLPGTGKSTVARGIGERLGFEVLRSDVIRKRTGTADGLPSGAVFGKGLYATEATDAVYAAMMDEAESRLERGESVVLDATFNHERHRQLARNLGHRTRSQVIEIRCVLDAAEAARRIESRTAAGTDPSDATPAIAVAMAAESDAWPESVALPTDAAAAAVIDAAADVLAGAGLERIADPRPDDRRPDDRSPDEWRPSHG